MPAQAHADFDDERDPPRALALRAPGTFSAGYPVERLSAGHRACPGTNRRSALARMV